jgi:hypothetical protein
MEKGDLTAEEKMFILSCLGGIISIIHDLKPSVFLIRKDPVLINFLNKTVTDSSNLLIEYVDEMVKLKSASLDLEEIDLKISFLNLWNVFFEELLFSAKYSKEVLISFNEDQFIVLQYLLEKEAEKFF